MDSSAKLQKSTVISVGTTFGIFTGNSDEAFSGFEQTELSSGVNYGGSITFYFPNAALKTFKAPGIEISIEHYSRVLSENNLDFGELSMTPISVRYKIQRFTSTNSQFSNGNGFGYNFFAGAGLSINGFEKGVFIKSLESSAEGQFSIKTNSSFFLEIGLGMDALIAKNVSLGLKSLYRYGNLGSDWTISNQYMTAQIPDFDTFHASGFQISGGLNFWF